MSESPSTHVASGKTPNGRFAKGNKLGVGNPMAGRAAKIRAELFRASRSSDVKEICRKLIDGARAGDLAFIKEWFDRTIGKSCDTLTEERIERLETLLTERSENASDASCSAPSGGAIGDAGQETASRESNVDQNGEI
jgi:hypothetical protein